MEGTNIAMGKSEDDSEKSLKKLEESLLELEESLLELKDADIKLDLKLKYPFDTEKYVYDPDSSLRAWEYYFEMYYEFLSNVEEEDKDLLFKEKFGKKFWLSGNAYKRVVGTFCYFENDKYIWPYKLDRDKLKEDQNIGIAGDCVFNFNEKKVPNFEKIIKKDNLNDQNTKEQIKVVLSLCSKMHYSPFNFSLMPTTGGLNNIKGRKALDRIDVFLNTLKNIYEKIEKKEEIEEINVTKTTGRALIHFLKCIGSFENYCKIFYQLDYKETKEKDLVERLLANGKNEDIENPYQLVEYMKLAVEYWEKQKEKYKKVSDTNKNQS